jgi:transcriptional regulator with XRE-family HTH domain
MKRLLEIPLPDVETNQESAEHASHVRIAMLIAQLQTYASASPDDHRFHAALLRHSSTAKANERFLDALLAYSLMNAKERQGLMAWIGETFAPASTVYPKMSTLISIDTSVILQYALKNEELKGAMLVSGFAPTARSGRDEGWKFRVRPRTKIGVLHGKSRTKPQGCKGTLGEMLRKAREAQGLGQRELARIVGISQAFLSKVENDEFTPPGEEKLKAIARTLGLEVDLILARAGRVASDVLQIIKNHPTEMAELVRATQPLSKEQILETIDALRRRRND